MNVIGCSAISVFMPPPSSISYYYILVHINVSVEHNDYAFLTSAYFLVFLC